ncbi:hypothetical protein BJ912DRAFT_1056216 [Pholiota molesta]|nr:hypothetical protein BJ912DRAFT_1056216 [Pholiota molesta]
MAALFTVKDDELATHGDIRLPERLSARSLIPPGIRFSLEDETLKVAGGTPDEEEDLPKGQTLDATLEDGRSVMLRQRNTYVSDPVLEKWSLGRFQNELRLLPWLRDNTSIPVANLLAIGPDYTIQEKLPGSDLTYRWHFLSEAAKKIGSASVDEAAGMGVGPLLASNASCSAPDVLDDISEYIDFLFTIKRHMIADEA